MTYIKLFIDVAKKKPMSDKKTIDPGPVTQDPSLEKRIREIFKEPLEELFDKPELVRLNFDSFYSYSQDYYNDLLNRGIKPGTEEISQVVNLIVRTDKNNEVEYYKNLFLLEYLGSKIE